MRVSLIVASLLCAACTIGGSLANQPFADIPVPGGWRAQAKDSLLIESPRVTAGRQVYFAESPVDATLDQARALLRGAGWTETKSERYVNQDKFAVLWADFAKGQDYCRITVTEGSGMQQVDVTVARLNAPR